MYVGGRKRFNFGLRLFPQILVRFRKLKGRCASQGGTSVLFFLLAYPLIPKSVASSGLLDASRSIFVHLPRTGIQCDAFVRRNCRSRTLRS